MFSRCDLLDDITLSADWFRRLDGFLCLMLLCLFDSLDCREEHFGVGFLLALPVDFDLALDQTNLIFDSFALFALQLLDLSQVSDSRLQIFNRAIDRQIGCFGAPMQSLDIQRV